MSLKKKIIIGFLVSSSLIALLAVFLLVNFVEIKKETTFLELTDTIRSKSLQLRRHEKNYFLYAPSKTTDETKAIYGYLDELDKIAAYLSKETDKKITLKHVNLFLDEASNDNIFHFLDALVARRAKEAIKLLHTQFDNGEEPGKIFNLIVGQWRKLLLIKDYFSLNPGSTSDNAAKALDIHPFVVKKTLAILPGFSFAKLKEIYRELLDIDLKAKTGEGDYASFLEMLVAKICQ